MHRRTIEETELHNSQLQHKLCKLEREHEDLVERNEELESLLGEMQNQSREELQCFEREVDGLRDEVNRVAGSSSMFAFSILSDGHGFRLHLLVSEWSGAASGPTHTIANYIYLCLFNFPPGLYVNSEMLVPVAWETLAKRWKITDLRGAVPLRSGALQI